MGLIIEYDHYIQEIRIIAVINLSSFVSHQGVGVNSHAEGEEVGM